MIIDRYCTRNRIGETTTFVIITIDGFVLPARSYSPIVLIIIIIIINRFYANIYLETRRSRKTASVAVVQEVRFLLCRFVRIVYYALGVCCDGPRPSEGTKSKQRVTASASGGIRQVDWSLARVIHLSYGICIL